MANGTSTRTLQTSSKILWTGLSLLFDNGYKIWVTINFAVLLLPPCPLELKAF